MANIFPFWLGPRLNWTLKRKHIYCGISLVLHKVKPKDLNIPWLIRKLSAHTDNLDKKPGWGICSACFPVPLGNPVCSNDCFLCFTNQHQRITRWPTGWHLEESSQMYYWSYSTWHMMGSHHGILSKKVFDALEEKLINGPKHPRWRHADENAWM